MDEALRTAYIGTHASTPLVKAMPCMKLSQEGFARQAHACNMKPSPQLYTSFPPAFKRSS